MMVSPIFVCNFVVFFPPSKTRKEKYMTKIDEKMLQIVVDMAARGGKMEALQEAQDKEIERLIEENRQLKAERAKDKERIRELEQLLHEQQAARPQVVVNNFNFFVLSVPRTRAYVDNLGNDGRQFVGHMLHHTMLEDTPRSMLDKVDEITQLKDCQEGGVVIQHNTGPVNGNIGTQNVGMPGVNDENSLKKIDDHGREKGIDADFE
jgi:hypothetical protein